MEELKYQKELYFSPLAKVSFLLFIPIICTHITIFINIIIKFKKFVLSPEVN